jgi:hypothetical protein
MTIRPSMTPKNSITAVDYLFKKYIEEQGRINDELSDISKALIKMEINTTHLVESHARLAKKVDRLEAIHLNCKARRDIDSVNARLKRLETQRDHDISTQINTEQQRTLAATEQKQTSIFFDKAFILKILPWLLLALMTGASFTGYLLARQTTINIPFMEDDDDNT